ncbi:uncharacterized protein BO80DRAFT_436581 [Aspergillus ibericus CBS 121593]|uniref:Uncharacterized protein n=1 Tax=Aspergillus ibericus CBS 121593 TaxID=1448316 RepID=A0A395GTP0_9EURO|nr:hypothetical protein BO80DRAFT_436581 [Aspergillus ibericus CBS 121593]RAK98941.1 hypothetical protein BO80DRAFT_436581 [Aspergillus ibericus CBS 121593]
MMIKYGTSSLCNLVNCITPSINLSNYTLRETSLIDPKCIKQQQQLLRTVYTQQHPSNTKFLRSSPFPFFHSPPLQSETYHPTSNQGTTVKYYRGDPKRRSSPFWESRDEDFRRRLSLLHSGIWFVGAEFTTRIEEGWRGMDDLAGIWWFVVPLLGQNLMKDMFYDNGFVVLFRNLILDLHMDVDQLASRARHQGCHVLPPAAHLPSSTSQSKIDNQQPAGNSTPSGMDTMKTCSSPSNLRRPRHLFQTHRINILSGNSAMESAAKARSSYSGPRRGTMRFGD